MTTDNKVIRWAKAYVNQLLIPLEQHYYHQYSHALEVMDRAVYLAKQEWLSDSDIEVLALAWLFHDTWFVIQYDNNEPIWAKIAQNYLISMLYDRDKIQLIEEIILATAPSYKNPKNIYEQIIIDADLDNFWREDFFDKMDNIQREREAIKHIKLLDPDWKHWVIDFLAEHKYFTKTQKTERNTQKEKNMSELEKMVQELENEEI